MTTVLHSFADLHLHSNASDGSDAPAAVVRRVAAAGFAAMALADHDTMAGVADAAAEAKKIGIVFIPAVECSTVDGSNEVHLLAYGLDPSVAEINETFQKLRSHRYHRARRMVEKLREIGVNISWQRVQELAGDENIGRPHIARAMQEAGYISTLAEAFTPEYIGTGGRAYVPRIRWETTDAIRRIREWGGVPVIAHPGRSGDGLSGIHEQAIARYVDAGLMGLEVFYPLHDEATTVRYLALARRYDLLVTGGSDDHGRFSDQQLLGSIRLPYEYVEKLLNAIERGPAGGG